MAEEVAKPGTAYKFHAAVTEEQRASLAVIYRRVGEHLGAAAILPFAILADIHKAPAALRVNERPFRTQDSLQLIQRSRQAAAMLVGVCRQPAADLPQVVHGANLQCLPAGADHRRHEHRSQQAQEHDHRQSRHYASPAAPDRRHNQERQSADEEQQQRERQRVLI